MSFKNRVYRIMQLFALTGLLIANGFILNYILRLDYGEHKDNSLIYHEECQPKDGINYFGFNPHDFHINLSKVASGQTISTILNTYNIPKQVSDKVIKNVSEYINVNSVKSGNTIGFISSNLCYSPDYFIYEINPSSYLVSELRGDHCVNIFQRKKEYKREYAAGIIESSLWSALQSQNISLDLIDQMEDALSTSVDFHHVQKGNTFKLIYDKLYIDGIPSSINELIAASFETDKKEHFSISYEVNNKKGFYDLNGSPMKSKFLRAPLRFSRISSGFNPKRLHPVLKYHRPHLGTDYAAPHGTPIMSVGSGVVQAASYTSGNGNYVKIRHDKTYETQYLHMSRFAKGIRKGTHVSQGQIIGYVGSTGLATGPHVCFRFWKNGKQVNHLRLIFPAPDPLPANQLIDYIKHRDELVKVFQSIQFNTALNKNSNS
jgi:murein DD-endopeptidase MepM/ murein hydrolase activator NlpD